MKSTTQERVVNGKALVDQQVVKGDPLLTQGEVAEIIGKSKAWLERMRWAGGGIPYKKIGHHVRYVESEVYAWINRQPSRHSTSE